ncbi:hypothetical protein [Paraburkholderia pallida]|uniref:Uncharacterized protein n=1 Tax=Paraburkholderia pallida TaxID=2547399 RepID=A0A4P7D0I3_9BURK|nr:hypothetical protein [Paraburkholderia pallida]QBR02149.1 hypothetical protein E1956_34120 [Paraburkholderia pallida]
MPFDPQKFKDTAGDTDLFYGLAKPRDALMQMLGAPPESQHGHKINHYDVGDVPSGNQLPPMSAEFKNWLGQHDKYKVGVDAGKYLWPHWRVKSKGGLQWATLVKGIDVHFCLDEMMGETHFTIPLKDYEDESQFKGPNFESGKPDWIKKQRAITNAELRWIYRNKDKAGVQEHVQFWLNGKPCVPPWEQSQEIKNLWAQYKPRSWT